MNAVSLEARSRPAHAPHELDAHVVLLKAGPTYRLSDGMLFHADAVGAIASGEIRTYGPVPTLAGDDRFPIVCSRLDENASLLSKLSYLLRTVRDVARSMRHARRRGLVVSYDPFLNGMVAVVIKWLTGARFICEVNGAYTDVDNWADLPRDVALAKQRKMLRVGSWVLRHADGIRILYDDQLRGFTGNFDGKVVRRYFDPVPVDRFRNLGEDRTILLIGYPYRRKGADIALQAWDQIRAEFPDWKLVLIGHELGRHAQASGVSLERVEAHPPMANERIAEWIGRAGVVIVPSRAEGLPRVLIEAGAAGKPRVGADVHGIVNIIEDGADGLLVPKEDPQALAGALRQLLASESLRRQLGDAARRRVERDFSTRRFQQLFHEQATAVLGRKR